MIKNPIRFIADDIKSDVKFLKDIGYDEQLQEEVKDKLAEAFKPKNVVADLKRNYIFFLLMIAFFLAGMFISAKYYQNECNQYIFETYIEPDIIAKIQNGSDDNYSDSVFGFHPSVSISPTPDSQPYIEEDEYNKKYCFNPRRYSNIHSVENLGHGF